MEEFIGGVRALQTNKHYRAAFYHKLCPDLMDQTITAKMKELQDKHIAESYGVQLSAVYIDHANNADAERPAFERMLADAKDGGFDWIITKSIERFAPTAEDTIQVIEELLSLPDPVMVYFESDMLDSKVIHSVVPILRGCCT